jgi:hypothetical protein
MASRPQPARAPGRRRRHLRVGVTAALAVGLLASSWSGTSAGRESGPAPVADTVAVNDSTTTADSPQLLAKKKKRNVIAWILSLGPGAPIGPPEFTAYRELQQLRCEQVFDRVAELDQPARRLYKGAAKACLAALDGRTRLWRAADAAYVSVAPRSAELTCMDQAALRLLRRLVVLHRRHPDRQFRLAPASAAQAPPCPDITALAPDHGPAGTVVRLTGENLVGTVSNVLVVDSDGTSLAVGDLTATLDGALQFTMPEAPPPEASPVVCVVVRAEPDWSADGTLFTYDVANPSAVPSPACPPPEDA